MMIFAQNKFPWKSQSVNYVPMNNGEANSKFRIGTGVRLVIFQIVMVKDVV